MKDKRIMARATQGLVLAGAALGTGILTWIIARSLGMHASAGGVLWAGGLVTVALGMVGSLLALVAVGSDDPQARGRAIAALVLCPAGVFASAFLIAVGQNVLAAH